MRIKYFFSALTIDVLRDAVNWRGRDGEPAAVPDCTYSIDWSFVSPLYLLHLYQIPFSFPYILQLLSSLDVVLHVVLEERHAVLEVLSNLSLKRGCDF